MLSRVALLTTYFVYRNADPEFMASVVETERYLACNSERFCGTVNFSSTPRIIADTAIRKARNSAVEEALRMDATHLAMVDQDMKFKRNAFIELLNLNKSICAPLFYNRDDQGEIFPCAFNSVDGGEEPWRECPKNRPFRCAAVGTGMILIDVEVFRNLEKPWFYYERNGRTMDVNFCRDAGKAGFEVWCDPRIAVSHAGIKPYEPEPRVDSLDPRPEDAIRPRTGQETT